MGKEYTAQEISQHYARRHELRSGIFGKKPYANYGYWTREDMSIDEACDAMTELVGTRLGLEEGDRLLECGCGYGASAVYVARRFRPGNIVGLDVTDVRIDNARKLIAEEGLAETIDVELGDATHLRFEDGSFDKVMAIECALHFRTRTTFLEEAFRVLRPGGILAMTDIILSSAIDPGAHTQEELRDFLGADLKHICDENIYSAPTYAGILESVGFSPVSVDSIKDRTILYFARHLERVAHESPPDARARRMAVADHFRTKFMQGGDYVVVRAVKPAGGARQE